MKRLVLVLFFALALAGVALAQCGPGGCPAPGGGGGVQLFPGGGNGPLSGLFGNRSRDSMSPMPRDDGTRAVHRIAVSSGGKAQMGTGTLIFNHGGVGGWLTVAHIFKGMPADSRVTVMLDGSKQNVIPARLVKADYAQDIALLESAAVPGRRPQPIADTYPSPRERVTFVGYGSDGTFKFGAGAVTSANRAFSNGGPTILEMTGEARQGDSGGPILNARSEIVGLVTGTGGGTVVGPRIDTIQNWIVQCGWTPWQNLQEQNNQLANENATLRAQLGQAMQPAPAPVPIPLPLPVPQPPAQCQPCPSPAVAAQLQAIDQDVAELQQATGILQQDMANVKAVGDKLSSVFPEVKTAIETVRAEAAADAAKAKGDAQVALNEAGEAKAEVSKVPEIAGKIAGEVVERTFGEKIKDALAPVWTYVVAHWGVTGLTVLALVYLVARRVQTGQSVGKRIAGYTPWTWDDEWYGESPSTIRAAVRHLRERRAARREPPPDDIPDAAGEVA